MNILRVVLIVIEIISCLMLVGVILLQQSKSGGMGTAFGGGMSETIFGSRAGNILTKVTITLAIVFLVNTTFLGMMYTTKQEGSIVDSAGVPASAPMAQPSQAAGSPQVPAPAQQGTMFTPDAENVVPVEVPASEPVTFEDVPAEPVTP